MLFQQIFLKFHKKDPDWEAKDTFYLKALFTIELIFTQDYNARFTI